MSLSPHSPTLIFIGTKHPCKVIETCFSNYLRILFAGQRQKCFLCLVSLGVVTWRSISLQDFLSCLNCQYRQMILEQYFTKLTLVYFKKMSICPTQHVNPSLKMPSFERHGKSVSCMFTSDAPGTG